MMICFVKLFNCQLLIYTFIVTYEFYSVGITLIYKLDTSAGFKLYPSDRRTLIIVSNEGLPFCDNDLYQFVNIQQDPILL